MSTLKKIADDIYRLVENTDKDIGQFDKNFFNAAALRLDDVIDVLTDMEKQIDSAYRAKLNKKTMSLDQLKQASKSIKDAINAAISASRGLSTHASNVRNDGN